jgi:hypothetical protein
MSADGERAAGPGLRVALRVMPTSGDRDRPSLAVRVDVAEPARPVRISVYVDGHLMETCAPAANGDEVRLRGLRGRHVITARAVDASGRWGGASTLIGRG